MSKIKLHNCTLAPRPESSQREKKDGVRTDPWAPTCTYIIALPPVSPLLPACPVSPPCPVTRDQCLGAMCQRAHPKFY